MSIIHEALKKAERERGPGITHWPLYHGMRSARPKWRWGARSGLLAGAMVAAVVGILGWRQSPVSGPSVEVVPALPQSSRAGDAGAVPFVGHQAIATLPLALARPLEAQPRVQSGGLASPSASAPLPLDVPADTAFARAREAESSGQWVQAERYYRLALAREPTLAEAHNNLGNLYVRQQHMSAAIGEFRAAMALNPNSARVRNNLGSAYLLIGEAELAIQEFIAALRLDSAYVSPYYNLASVYARRGEVGQAVAFLTKALALEAAVVSWVQDDPDFERIKAASEFLRWRAQAQGRR
jgi:tetratricopeptide (TPR) repeat protein